MTSLDIFDLDDRQDLSIDDAYFLNQISPQPYSPNSLGPIIIGILTVILLFIFNTEFIHSKLTDIPYYKLSLAGLIFSIIVIVMLFL